MKRTVFVVLGVIAAAPAWARTLDDNPVINSYRQHPGVGGTHESNFMSDAYQRHGPGTHDDNFMQDTAIARTPTAILTIKTISGVATAAVSI
jgi:hypothetical protein